MESVDYKICTKCGNNLPLGAFHLKKGGKHGRRADCASCAAEYQAKRRNGPKRQAILDEKKRYSDAHPEIRRTALLRDKYNLTLEEYDAKLKSQNGLCAICGSDTPLNSGHKHMYVDHNHVTGQVRGLLCNPCNTTIGAAKEDLERLSKCIEYLKSYSNLTEKDF